MPCLGAYLTPDLLGGGKTVMLGNLIQNQFTTARDWPFGSAASLVLMVVAGVILRLMRAAWAGAIMRTRTVPAYAALAYLFLHAPLLALVVFSFNASKFTVWQGFSLDWYRAIFHDPQLAEAAGNSVIIAVASALISTVIGTLAAYGMWKRAAPFLSGSLYLSLVTPEIVTGISLLVFFQWIFHWLRFQLGMETVIIAHVAFSIAYVTIVISARLNSMDSLEEAGSISARRMACLLARHASIAAGNYSGRPPRVDRIVRRLCDHQPCSRRRFRNPSHGDLCDGAARRESRHQRHFVDHRRAVWRFDTSLGAAS